MKSIDVVFKLSAVEYELVKEAFYFVREELADGEKCDKNALKYLCKEYLLSKNKGKECLW